MDFYYVYVRIVYYIARHFEILVYFCRTIRDNLRDFIAIICNAAVEFIFIKIQEAKCYKAIRLIMLYKYIAFRTCWHRCSIESLKPEVKCLGNCIGTIQCLSCAKSANRWYLIGECYRIAMELLLNDDLITEYLSVYIALQDHRSARSQYAATYLSRFSTYSAGIKLVRCTGIKYIDDHISCSPRSYLF